MDSATLLAFALDSKHEVLPVAFHYPSKHNKLETEAASAVARHYGLVLEHVVLGFMEGFQTALFQADKKIPEGHYEAESMKATVVPARNMIFASILAGFAWNYSCKEVWLGIHAGDHAIYPDCRPEFFAPMSSAIRHGTDGRVKLEAPFLYKDKHGILLIGQQLKVPYELTRTCYTSNERACGKCGSCQERLEAFSKIGKTDPINYESRALMPK
jgi:7-cyano-7-deazaguanine synthase